jgi:hypothetical protein
MTILLSRSSPASEVIGVCLSVAAEFDPRTFRHSWDVDLFQNMVSTALE